MSVQQNVEANAAAERSERRLSDLFRAHTSPAFERLTRTAAGLVEDREPTPSLANCEKVPTSETGTAQGRDDIGGGDRPVTAATEAVRASISRDRERQRKVLALIGADEPAHAKRVALCRRRSVELGCTTCGGDNYVPMRCDSRLCPECMAQKMGATAGQYAEEVAGWDHPTMFRLSLPDRVEPDDLERGVDALRGAFGRLLRRVVPANGDGWAWSEWARHLRMVGERDLAARLRTEYVSEGRGVPFSEVVRGGFYGIDIKEKDDGRLNVHLHVLADVPWLPQAALSSVWGDVSGAPVVDIRRVDGRGEADMESAVMEVVGYAAKPPEFESVETEVEYLTTLKGSKLVQPFGDLHGNTPDASDRLRCGECEMEPMWGWEYKGVVTGCYSTALVGSAPDGDRPPDSR